MFRKKTERVEKLNHLSCEEPDENGRVKTACGLMKKTTGKRYPDPSLRCCTICYTALFQDWETLMDKYEVLVETFNNVVDRLNDGRDEFIEISKNAGNLLSR